jgi:hypothetical protein
MISSTYRKQTLQVKNKTTLTLNIWQVLKMTAYIQVITDGGEGIRQLFCCSKLVDLDKYIYSYCSLVVKVFSGWNFTWLYNSFAAILTKEE